eukprot:scaffold301191_cov33-Tisochrysis_lutea.AAC.2
MTLAVFLQAHSWAVQRSFGPNDGPGVWGWGTRLLELGISLALLYLCSLVVIGMKVRHAAGWGGGRPAPCE